MLKGTQHQARSWEEGRGATGPLPWAIGSREVGRGDMVCNEAWRHFEDWSPLLGSVVLPKGTLTRKRS